MIRLFRLTRLGTDYPFAFLDRVDAVRRGHPDLFHRAAGPADLNRIHSLIVAQAEMNPGIVRRCEAAPADHICSLGRVRVCQIYRGSDGIARAPVSPLHLYPAPVMAV